MKKIEFKNQHANTLYNDYMLRAKRMLKPLSIQDQEDILMELNSHIYESMKHDECGSELDKLVDVIQKLGAPEITLKQLVADKKMNEAVKTFNPVDVIKALFLNIANGFSYIVFAILYLLLAVCTILIPLKIISPNNTGLFMLNGKFYALGYISNASISRGIVEILGWYFIPLIITLIIIAYIIITLLLRLKRNYKSKLVIR